MAVIGATDTRSAGLIENIGKDIQVIKVAKTDITTAELTTMVEEASLTSTVIAVKCAAAFASGTTDVIHLVLEGGAYAVEGSNALGVTGAVTTLAAGFEV
tara:strand:- start:291 stop:590 length:300 start_codon:yes stop_codon:yes gene_type:complete